LIVFKVITVIRLALIVLIRRCKMAKAKKWTGPVHVKWSMNQLETTAKVRGYALEEVKPCIVKTHDDGMMTVDVNHKNFPREKEFPGAGTELKKLLAKVGIVATPNCTCNKRAIMMNVRGIEWCEENIDTIVGWLRDEAKARKLPFVDLAGKALVKMAIKRAKKHSSK
jgi:hypothetical protein